MKFLLNVCLCLLAFMLLSGLNGQSRHQGSPDDYPKASVLELFFDTLAHKSMNQKHVPGLVVSVMNTDSILFSKGYGFADLAEKRKADPDQTIWRLASISKVVTGTAVMQLVEAGQADLDEDINNYLQDFRIPEKFGKAVTLRHLLTHTAGFDDRYLNKSFRTEEEWLPLKQFVAEILPERIFPPGEIYSYSNVGNALAAVVVEDISGQEFNNYCIEHIFLPLGMKRTNFRLSRELKKDLYTGYGRENDGYREYPFDFLGDYPAGQLLSTANEFARFMICHLNGGIYDSVRILSEETVREMHAPQFKHHPKLGGAVGYTFHMNRENGRKLLRHSGGYMGLATRMWLIPEENIALFMACNTGGTGIMHDLSHAFMDSFFPEKKDAEGKYPLENLPEYDKDVDKYTGYYRGTRYTHTDFTKAFLLSGMVGEVKIRKNDKGMLMMHDWDGDIRRMIQVKPGLFRSIDDDYHMAFRLNKEGEPTFLFTSGTHALEKVPYLLSIDFHRMLIAIILGIFFLLLLVRLARLIWPKKWKTHREWPEGQKCMRRQSNIIAALFLLHWIFMGLVLFVIIPPYELFQTGLSYGLPWSMYLVQLLPLMAAILLLVLIFRYFQNIGNSEVSGWAKVFYAFYILIVIVYLLMLNYWNLLGFKFG